MTTLRRMGSFLFLALVAAAGVVWSCTTTRTPCIEFLDRTEAAEVFGSNAFWYLSLYRHAESVAKGGGLVNTDAHDFQQQMLLANSRCHDWKPSEIEVVQQTIREHRALQRAKWRLIKADDRVDFSYPYTIGDCVVLPANMLAAAGSSENRLSLAKTLLHEHVHIFQRQHPGLFDTLYNAWGFRRATRIDIPADHKERTVTNPDGLDAWVFSCPDGTFTMGLFLEGGKPVKKAFRVSGPDQKGAYVAVGDPIELREISQWLFGIEGCYHPHEVHAYLVSESAFGQ